MILSNIELYEIKGGSFSLSVSALNAVARLMSTLLKIGQVVGSNIRRGITKSYC